VLGRNLSLSEGSASKKGSIFLTIDQSQGVYLDAAGRESSEGHAVMFTEKGAMISGSSSLGVWWGTRSMLQILATSNDTIPTGTAVDTTG